jgi:hypothetical protein
LNGRRIKAIRGAERNKCSLEINPQDGVAFVRLSCVGFDKVETFRLLVSGPSTSERCSPQLELIRATAMSGREIRRFEQLNDGAIPARIYAVAKAAEQTIDRCKAKQEISSAIKAHFSDIIQ